MAHLRGMAECEKERDARLHVEAIFNNVQQRGLGDAGATQQRAPAPAPAPKKAPPRPLVRQQTWAHGHGDLERVKVGDLGNCPSPGRRMSKDDGMLGMGKFFGQSSAPSQVRPLARGNSFSGAPDITRQGSFGSSTGMSLRSFLQSIDALDCAPLLEAQRLDMPTLAACTEDELERIGVPMGPRKKIVAHFAGRAPQHLGEGVLSGVEAVGKGLFDGVTGLVAEPVRGVQEGGVMGGFEGLGRGLVGAVVAPVRGAVDGVEQVATGAWNTRNLFG